MKNRKIEMDALRQKQEQWLMTCLQRNASSCYGQRYRFEGITTLHAYQTTVPMVNYETLEPFLMRIANGESDVLFQGIATAFEVTGGSVGGGKLIPYSTNSFEDFQRAILPWLYAISQRYGIRRKATYWSISPALARAKTTDGGIPIGVSDGEYLGSTFDDTVVVPSWVGELRDVYEWQLATLYYLIRCEALELISVWSPTFLLMLLDILDERFEELLSLFAQGGKIDEQTLVPHEEALQRLLQYGATKNTVTLWPQMKLISCWQDGSSKPFFDQLRDRFSHVAFQPKGLIATEGVITIPNAQGIPLLSPESGFYEFLHSTGEIYLAHELTTDNSLYEVVLTTAGGLYRYRMGDMVACEGYEEGLPILRFRGRKGIVSDMVGEKLNDLFVQKALKNIKSFSMLVPDHTRIPHYILLSDEAITPDTLLTVETQLMENPQYAYARKIGQLGSLEVRILTNALRVYIDYKIRMGSRVGDIKIPSLHDDAQWLQMIQEDKK